jgi:hypothetical protein
MGVADLKAVAKAMAHSPVHQYVVPGLTSSLVGGPGHGTVRLFESDRDTREWVTPHSHRFDFACLVLAGEVENLVYTRSIDPGGGSNAFAVGTCRPLYGSVRGLGEYEIVHGTTGQQFIEGSNTYVAGDVYAMKHDEIHSIRFSKGAKVLFFEGPEVAQESVFLEPFSNGKTIPTFKVEPWMFERGGS